MSIVGNEIKRLGLMSMYEFLDKDPEENLPKLVDWLDSYIDPEVLKPQRQPIPRLSRRNRLPR